MYYLCTSEEERAHRYRVFSSFFGQKNGFFTSEINFFTLLRKNFLGVCGFFLRNVDSIFADIERLKVKRYLFLKLHFFRFKGRKMHTKAPRRQNLPEINCGTIKSYPYDSLQSCHYYRLVLLLLFSHQLGPLAISLISWDFSLFLEGENEFVQIGCISPPLCMKPMERPKKNGCRFLSLENNMYFCRAQICAVGWLEQVFGLRRQDILHDACPFMRKV